MNDVPANPAASRESRFATLGWVLAICAILALVYAPLLTWMGKVSLQTSQISNAAVVVLMTLAVCVRSVLAELRFAPQITSRGVRLLAAGFAILLIATQVRQLALPLVLVSFCLSFAGVVAFLFAGTAVRQFWPAFMAFVVFGLLAGLFPTLDWPLRRIAGRWAQLILSKLGVAAQLRVQPDQVYLTVQNKSYLVATECNGFGFLTSYLILAAVLGFFYKLSWPARIGLVLLAVPIGLVFNSLRIVGICLATESVPLPYAVVHEAMGLIFIFAGVGVIFWLAGWWSGRRQTA